MNCIVCKKPISILEDFGDETDPVSACWCNAGVHEFIVGFGSRHDTERFVIGICDDCLDTLEAT
jgi:hypothetical protein